MGKKAKNSTDAFSLDDEEDTKDGAWQTYRGKSTTARSTARRETIAKEGPSVLYQVRSAIAASSSKRATVGAMKKLETCIEETKVLATDELSGPEASEPTVRCYSQLSMLDCMVASVVATINRSIGNDEPARVASALLGVGELDCPSSCLQWALGMAFIRRLHGQCGGRILIDSIVTYDPLISFGQCQDEGAEGATSASKPDSPNPQVKGLEGYVQAWNTSVKEDPIGLPRIAYDKVNRFGAYAVDEEGTNADKRRVLVAFTPHCPRELYHNLIVANLGASGGANSPLNRLIIIGNDITRYMQSDKRCISEAISAVAHAVPSGFGIVRSDLFDTIGSIPPLDGRGVGQTTSSDAPQPVMSIVALETLLTSASSRTATASYEAQLSGHLAAKGSTAESHAEPTLIGRKLLSVPAKGKYGPYSFADSERAFSDMCIATFGSGTAERLLQGPQSRRILVTTGGDLL